MTTFRASALDHADDYRAAALDRANRGRASGKHAHRVYMTTAAMYAGRDETSGDEALFLCRDGWRLARDAALDTLRFALFGDVFEGVEL